MKYSCGCTGKPSKAQQWAAIARADLAAIPEPHRHELVTFLNTPGFSNAFFERILHRDHTWVWIAKGVASSELNEDEALENWNSITREDAIYIAQHRPPGEYLPLIVVLYALDDYDTYPARQVHKTWNVYKQTLHLRRHYGPLAQAGGYVLPDWFRAKLPF